MGIPGNRTRDMRPHDRPHPELLLSHLGWIRELARHLVMDRELAEDAKHDAFIDAYLKSKE